MVPPGNVYDQQRMVGLVYDSSHTNSIIVRLDNASISAAVLSVCGRPLMKTEVQEEAAQVPFFGLFFPGK